ncbi:MAG TPA: hypothetical protein VGL53_12235, partial [Bryobacteraceae bacterium]
CTPESLAHETIANAAHWRFASKAGPLKSRPVLIVTSDDGLAHSNDAFANILRLQTGNSRVKTVHFATDHSYSDQRIALSNAVLAWLAQLPTGN